MSIFRRNKSNKKSENKDESSIIEKAKKLGRKLVGRNNRIEQDVYIFQRIFSEVIKCDLGKEIFCCELDHGEYKIGLAGKDVLVNRFKDIEFKDILGEAQKKYPAFRKGKSSIEVWWKKCSNRENFGDNYIRYICKMSNENIKKFGEISSGTILAACACLSLMKIDENTEYKKFFSSLKSSDPKIVCIIDGWNSFVDKMIKKLIYSLKKAESEVKEKNKKLMKSSEPRVEKESKLGNTEDVREKLKEVKECVSLLHEKSSPDVKIKHPEKQVKILENSLDNGKELEKVDKQIESLGDQLRLSTLSILNSDILHEYKKGFNEDFLDNLLVFENGNCILKTGLKLTVDFLNNWIPKKTIESIKQDLCNGKKPEDKIVLTKNERTVASYLNTEKIIKPALKTLGIKIIHFINYLNGGFVEEAEKEMKNKIIGTNKNVFNFMKIGEDISRNLSLDVKNTDWGSEVKDWNLFIDTSNKKVIDNLKGIYKQAESLGSKVEESPLKQKLTDLIKEKEKFESEISEFTMNSSKMSGIEKKNFSNVKNDFGIFENYIALACANVKNQKKCQELLDKATVQQTVVQIDLNTLRR